MALYLVQNPYSFILSFYSFILFFRSILYSFILSFYSFILFFRSILYSFILSFYSFILFFRSILYLKIKNEMKGYRKAQCAYHDNMHITATCFGCIFATCGQIMYIIGWKLHIFRIILYGFPPFWFSPGWQFAREFHQRTCKTKQNKMADGF